MKTYRFVSAAALVASLLVTPVAVLHAAAPDAAGPRAARSVDVPVEVMRVIRDHASADHHEVTPSATLRKDLGLDKLGVVELVLALEEHFEINVPDNAQEAWLTVADVIQYVEKAVKEHAK